MLVIRELGQLTSSLSKSSQAISLTFTAKSAHPTPFTATRNHEATDIERSQVLFVDNDGDGDSNQSLGMNDTSTSVGIVIGIVLAVLAIGFLIFLIAACITRRSKKPKPPEPPNPDDNAPSERRSLSNAEEGRIEMDPVGADIPMQHNGPTALPAPGISRFGEAL